jgi:hypothetical protein
MLSSISQRSPRTGCMRTIPAVGDRINVEGFVNTVEQAQKMAVIRWSTPPRHRSTSQTDPSAESVPVNGQTAYEASKLIQERYAEYFVNHYDMNMHPATLRIRSLRMCMSTTPARLLRRSKAQLGQSPRLVLRKVLRGFAPITGYPNDWGIN